MLEWQDDRSKMALQLNLSCHELANDTKHAYVSSNTTAATDWIAQKEDAKEDASKDGMEALMTKKFSLNNWPWLELPFDIYQPLVVNICRAGQDLDCIPRRCQGRCPQRWNGMPNRPTHLSKGFGIPYWSFWCTIHQPTAHSSRDI